MKVLPNLADGTVHIILMAREAVGMAEKLFRAAAQSGGPIDDESPESTERDMEERER